MERDIEKPRVIIGSGILGKQWKLDYNFFWKFVSGYESSRFASPPVPQPLGDFHTFNLNLTVMFEKRVFIVVGIFKISPPILLLELQTVWIV